MARRPASVIDESDTRWHLDRKVPISIIITILLQTGAVMWWAARADERINTLEQKMLVLAPQGDRLTRVEVNIETIKDSLTEIKATLRKPK